MIQEQNSPREDKHQVRISVCVHARVRVCGLVLLYFWGLRESTGLLGSSRFVGTKYWTPLF